MSWRARQFARRQPKRTGAWGIAAFLCVGCATSGGHLSHDVGHDATLGVVNGLAQTSPEEMARIRQKIFGDVDLQKIAHDVAKSAIAGSAAGLDEVQLTKRIEALVQSAMDVVVRNADGAVAQMLRENAPQIQAMLVASVRDMIRGGSAALVEAAREHDLEGATQRLAAKIVNAALDQLQRSVQEMVESASRQIAPAFASLAGDATTQIIRAAKANLTPDDVTRYAKAMSVGVALGIRESNLTPGFSGFEVGLITASVVSSVLALAGGILAFVLLRRYRGANRSLQALAERVEQFGRDHPDAGGPLAQAIREQTGREQPGGWVGRVAQEPGR